MNEKEKKLLEFAKNAKDRKKKANEKQYDSFDRVSVVLPKGTNLALETKHTDGEDGLITAKNKWLIAHKDGNQGDVFIGLVGENLNVNK